MSGKVFISYRREESRSSARRLYDQLSAHFDRKQILMDIDAIAQDADFVKAIEKTVGECDLLIALIGAHWLTSTDEQGRRRLDNPEDFVRIEIATALKREIRLVPVLVDGALMPRQTDLPDDLKPLVRRNALRISDTGFDADCRRLVAAIEQVFKRTTAERRERKKRERLETGPREAEPKVRLEAERRPKDKQERLAREPQSTPPGAGAPLPPPAPTRVFISYSHDSVEHARRVRALADRLRVDGIEVWIDQYTQDPNEGWMRWMRSQVKQANRVLLVFTETYQRRFEGEEEEGQGLGATFEGVIVTQALYESGGQNAKFRPVVFREEDERFIPSELRRFNRYRVDTPENYEALLRWLHEAPRIVAPIVGHKPDLPPDPGPKLFPKKRWPAGVIIASMFLVAVGLIGTILLIPPDVEIRGAIVDEQQNAISGVRVNIVGHSAEEIETDRSGDFKLKSHVGKNQQVRLHFEKTSFHSVEDYYPVGQQPITVTLQRLTP